jgi:hypothetical protein
LDNNKTCFVICPIGDEGSPTRICSDLTFDYIIKPVVKKYGYNLNRADRMGKTGMISNHIIKQLLDSDLVIADLTDYNPNVFYELAIRHITQKPCIQMIKNGLKLPFDVYGIQTVFFETDLASAEIAKNRLCKQIELIEKGEFKVTNPITPVHDNPLIQQALQESKRDLTENEILLSILENVNYLTNETLGIQREISSLKESRNYIGNLGNKILNSNFDYADLKRDLDSINQELFLLNNIYGMLNYNVENVKETLIPGEGWALNEAVAERAVIEKRIEFLKNAKNNIENLAELNPNKNKQARLY